MLLKNVLVKSTNGRPLGWRPCAPIVLRLSMLAPHKGPEATDCKIKLPRVAGLAGAGPRKLCICILAIRIELAGAGRRSCSDGSTRGMSSVDVHPATCGSSGKGRQEGVHYIAGCNGCHVLAVHGHSLLAILAIDVNLHGDQANFCRPAAVSIVPKAV